VPFLGRLCHYLTQCRPGRGLPLYQWHLDLSSRLATIHGSKSGGCCGAPFWGRAELGPHLDNVTWPRYTSVPSGILIHPAVWPQHKLHGPKSGSCFAPLLGEAGCPSNTMWPGPRRTSMLSFILIHPTVWTD